MSNYNPHSYGTKEYYQFEVAMAKRSSELVKEAAIAEIVRMNKDEQAHSVMTQMSQVVLYADAQVKSAEYCLKDYLEKHGNENN